MRNVYILIALIALISFVDSNSNEVKKKMNKAIKDLYNADFSDLHKLGINYLAKPAGFRGRGSYTRIGGVQELEEETKDAVPGKCDPKPVCISNPLTLNITSTQFAFPPCINIHRCDGCCASNEQCIAIKSHEVKLQKVGVINFEEGNESPKFSETFISVLNHTDCQCQCKWQSDNDCKAVNPNYVLDQNSCECVCPNDLYCGPLREFDHESCTCKCRKANFGRLEQNCKHKGYNWSDAYCKCETTRTSVNQKVIRMINS